VDVAGILGPGEAGTGTGLLHRMDGVDMARQVEEATGHQLTEEVTAHRHVVMGAQACEADAHRRAIRDLQARMIGGLHPRALMVPDLALTALDNRLLAHHLLQVMSIRQCPVSPRETMGHTIR
jgi:hypothetical protein